MSIQQDTAPTPAASPGARNRIRRAVLVGGLLAALTVACWLLVTPWDWTPSAARAGAVYASSVHPWQWGVIGLVLLTLSAAAGALGYRLLSLLCVATPAFVLFSYQTAAAHGGNVWVVASIGVAPVIYGTVAVVALLGHLARRRVLARRGPVEGPRAGQPGATSSA